MILHQPIRYEYILTFLLCELVKETRLAHTHVTNDDVFEDVGVVVGSSCRHDGHQYLFCLTMNDDEGSVTLISICWSNDAF